MTTFTDTPVGLEDIVISELIASRIHFLRETPPSLYIAENERSNTHIQALVRQVTDLAPETAISFIPLDEVHALNKGLRTPLHQDLTLPQRKVVELFRQAVKRGSSDIHLCIGEDGVTLVKFRIHGELQKVDSISKEEGEKLASTIILSMCDVTETQFVSSRPQDGRIKSEFVQELGLYGARYAHSPTVYGIFAVMRLIKDDSASPPTLSDLGFLAAQQQTLRNILNIPEGVIILSGPTGSGKSSTLRTLATMYLEQHQYQRNLVTYEDPPEGHITGAVQCAIVADKNNPDEVQYIWRRFRANTLRIDPDAILVGEIRDPDSADSSINNAMTGHLVLSTTHANDAINILERLQALDVRPALLSDHQLFIGLISQRLVQVLCPHCKISWNKMEQKLEPQLRELLSQTCDTHSIRFRNHTGCAHCESGIAGRRVVAEIIHTDAGFMQRYRLEGKRAARRYWMQHLNGITRNKHVVTLINQGLVDPHAAELICPLDEDRRLLSEEETDNET